MRKQEMEMQRRQIAAEREQFYRNNPELAEWVKTKKMLRNILLAFWILHSVFSLLLFAQMQATDDMGTEVFKLVIQLFWLCVFLNPEGGWKLNIIVYVWALTNFGLLVMNASVMIGMMAYIRDMPLLGVVMLMEALTPFLLLSLALYLTAVPKHRAMSEQLENFAKETMQKMKKI